MNVQLPLTKFEYALIHAQQRFPQNSAYSLGYITRVACKSLSKLIEAAHVIHQSCSNLRSYFLGSFKYIDESVALSIQVLDRPDWTDSEMTAFFLQKKQDPFDLSSGPLYKIFIVTTKKENYFSIICSHAILDGYSIYLYMSSVASYLSRNLTPRNDLELIKSLPLMFPVEEKSHSLKDSIFTLSDQKTSPYSAHTVNFELPVGINKSASNRHDYTVIINSLQQWLDSDQLYIKHLRLNRTKSHCKLLAFLADSKVQKTPSRQVDFLSQIKENDCFFKNDVIDDEPDRAGLSRAEIVYCDFSSMFSKHFNQPYIRAIFSPMTQPASPHMWADDVKLKINRRIDNKASRIELRALTSFVSPHDLNALASLIVRESNKH